MVATNYNVDTGVTTAVFVSEPGEYWEEDMRDELAQFFGYQTILFDFTNDERLIAVVQSMTMVGGRGGEG
ncbi:MAG TPA: hypothetical protein VE544_13305 [Nitrososphaeraceae archaeon]|jgi:hypothetical protein|nr:hypothetical protein [Nitrososphaeraceae archaeon]